MPKKKIPDPAAVSLGRKGGKARLKSLTPERRSAIARHAVMKRYGKTTPPDRWYELVALPADYVWRGTAHAAEVLGEVEANPEVILASHDRAEVVARSNRRDLRDRTTLIIERAYNPKGLTIQREYAPDAGAQLRGLKAVLDADGGKS